MCVESAPHLAVDQKRIYPHAGCHPQGKVGQDATHDRCKCTGEGSGCNNLLHVQAWVGSVSDQVVRQRLLTVPAVPRICGLTSRMYDMVRKVMIPARISVLILEPRSDILKNLQRVGITCIQQPDLVEASTTSHKTNMPRTCWTSGARCVRVQTISEPHLVGT